MWSYTINKIRKLASQCTDRTLAGTLFLSNIDKGILPQTIHISTFTEEEQNAFTSVHDFAQNFSQHDGVSPSISEEEGEGDNNNVDIQGQSHPSDSYQIDNNSDSSD